MKSSIRWYIPCLILWVWISGCAAPPEPTLTNEEKEILGEIMDILNATIAETEEKLHKNPDPTSPLKGFSRKLAKRREQVLRILSDQDPYDAEILQKIRDEVRQFRTNIEYPAELVMEADVSFGLGQYKIAGLSEEGREVLNRFAGEVMNSLIRQFKEEFPGKPLFVRIKTIGYADEAVPGKKLSSELIPAMEGKLPEDAAQRRQWLNRELSARRARTIADYIRDQLKSVLNDPLVEIDEPESIGLGEELPYPAETINPAYTPKDKRRRICKIHGNVFFREE